MHVSNLLISFSGTSVLFLFCNNSRAYDYGIAERCRRLDHTATGNCAWRPTQYKSIYMRQHRHSVRVRGAYHGSFGTLAEALNTLESLGEDVVQDRSKREDIKNYLEREPRFTSNGWPAVMFLFGAFVCQ